VQEHFQLLEDTLLAATLPPFKKKKKRAPVATSKFYLFDIGIANYLMKRGAIRRGSPEYGRVLEHFIFLECLACLSYKRLDLPFTFWRSQSKMEVDFVIGDKIGIEVKASERITDRDMKGLRALNEEVPLDRKLIVSHEKQAWRSDDGIEVLPVEEFLRLLWAGSLFQRNQRKMNAAAS